ncbi:MAG TPA: glycosyltransferase family 4 protein, partial [Ktedonobacteraceae bacterium]|nr:glycosyltransferase family 4 protein [Ktedonobacteraceae bacterium]
MSSIRVATITYDRYPFEPRAQREAEAAAAAGNTVDVICVRGPGQKRFDVYNGVRICRMPMDRQYGGSLPKTILAWLWFALLTAIAISWLHMKRRYDVVHVHNMPDFLVFSAVFPRLFGAKVILDVQDVSPELMTAKASGRLRKALIHLATWQESISIRFAHHVVTTGWPFEKLLLQRGVSREKLSSILNSADPNLFPASRRQPPPLADAQEGQPLVLIYHGKLADRTGLDVAIRAFALARPVVPNLRFDIKAGNSKVRAALKRLAEELGVGEAVVFSDPCASDKLIDFVLHGNIGIIPYRADGFEEYVLPTKAYEFAWMQRPIIASDTVAIRSMFRPESIVLCEPGNPHAFAEAIIDLAEHPEKRAALAAKAFVDYLPYRWETM